MSSGDYLYAGQSGYEIFDTVQEDYSLTGASIRVTLNIPWERRFEIARELLTGRYIKENENADAQSQYEQFCFPAKFPRRKDMYVSSVSVRPMPTQYEEDGQAIKYRQGLMTITYAPIATEVSFESSSQFVTINATNCCWNLTEKGVSKRENIVEGEFPGILVPSHTITLSRPYVNLKNVYDSEILDIFSLEGTCNSSGITFSYCGLTKIYPSETLAFQAPSMRGGYRISDGQEKEPCFSLSCKLVYNPLTHNKWFHPRQDGNDEDPLGSRAVEMLSGDSEDSPPIKVLKPVDYNQLFYLFGINEG